MRNMKKILSFLLAARLALSCVPVGVLAAENGLCAHHPQHTPECGYVETVEGHDCEHVCGEDCRQQLTNCAHIHGTGTCTYVEAREDGDCTCGGLVHTAQCASVTGGDCDCAMEPGHAEDCGYSEDLPASGICDHTVCTAEDGCVTSVEACIHTGHDETCGYVEAKGAPCEYVCQECVQADSGNAEDVDDEEDAAEEEEEPVVQTVDFMEYLEDPILIAFQSGGDIDLHDYLVNAYGVPAEIPFTCKPAVVSYGEYEDGSLISVTITAGEGYEGSCTVEAEVRYMNAFADYHVYPTVTYLVNQKANYSDAVGKQLLSVTIQAERECWYDFYEVDGNSYMPFNGIFQDGFSPDFTIRVYVRSNEIIQAGIGVNDWGRQGDGRAIYKDFTFHFQNSPYVNLPDVTWTNYQRDWLYQYYNKVDLPYTGKPQDFATVDSYSNGDVTKENCSGIGAGTYTAKVTVKLNDGLSALDSQSPDYAGIKWQEEAQESGRKVYTKTNTVTIVPVNPTVTTTPGSLTINASTEYTPADLVADSGAGIQVTGVGDDGILPASISYTWSDGTSAAKVPGTSETIKATITPTGPLAQNYNTVTASVTVNVTKRITGKSYETKSYEYNGMGQNLAIVNWSDSGVLYTIVYQDSQGNTYSGSDLPVCVDEYTVSVQLSDGWLFEDGTTKQYLPRKAEITPKSVRLTDIEVAEKVYDGTNTAEDIGTFEIDGILAADKADITHHANYTFEDKNVGNWSVAVSDIALGGSKAKNYSLLDGSGVPVTDWTTTGTITKKSVTVTVNNDLFKTYGAKDPQLTWSASPALVDGDVLSVQVTREDGEAVRDGGYNITVTEVQGDNPNYEITFVPGIFTIKPKELTIDIIAKKQFDNTADIDLVKDTFQYTLTSNQVLTDDEVILDSYTGKAYFSGSEVGENLTVNLEGNFTISGQDAGNYVLTQPVDVTGRIYNDYDAVVGTDYGVSHDDWTNGAVTITAGENRLLATELGGEWTTDLSYSDEAANTDGRTAAFFVKNADGDISLQEMVTYKIDKTNPSGAIALKNRTPWEELVSNITFDMFFNYEQTVTITAEDKLSDVEKIEYLESNAGLTQSDLDAAQWTEYQKPVPVSLEDAKQFVYYTKITDKAGNVTYLSTDGAVYDTTAPVIAISGQTENHVYYTTQKITVSDINLVEVLMNEQPQADSFTVPGDVTEKTVYSITAKDRAENTTTVTMTMLPISALDDKIEDLTTDNATSADLKEIQKVLDTAQKLLQEDIPEAEKKKLEDIQNNARKLKDAVEEARSAVDNSTTQKVEDKTEANVKLEDQADLEAAKKLLEEALKEENKGNYTPAEQSEIRKDIDRLEKAIAAIQQTEDVIEAIEKLPDSVETDLDEKTEKAIHETKAAYDQLTDHQKSLIDKDDREKLEELLSTLVDYRIIRGPGKWEKGSGKDLRFTANGPDRKFKELRIDGRVVRPYNYFIKNGTIILKASYLEKLSTGKYRIQVVYTDGETSGRDFFRVYNSGSNPSTGDSMNLMLASSVAAASLLCLAAMAVFVFRNKEKYRQ